MYSGFNKIFTDWQPRQGCLAEILQNSVAAKALRLVCIQAALFSVFCSSFGVYCNLKSDVMLPSRSVAMFRMVLLLLTLLHPSSLLSS
jgi:hypothetical protein